MENLPDVILGEIMFYLTPKELYLSYALINKMFHSLSVSDYFISTYAQWLLGMSRRFEAPSSYIVSVMKRVLDVRQKSRLKFKGFATTGGVDEDSPIYWVNNLYSKSANPYCSRDSKNNINTAGVLLKTQLEERDLDPVRKQLALFFRTNPYLNTLVRENFLQELRTLAYREEIMFEQIWRELQEHLLNHYSQNKEDMRNTINQQWEMLKNQRPEIQKYHPRETDLYYLVQNINKEQADNGRTVFVTDEVHISREGEYTCPLQTFVIFISDKYVDVEHEDFSIFNDLVTSEDVEQLLSSPIGDKIKASETIEVDGTFYKILNGRIGLLQPLIWGKFTNRNNNLLKAKLDRFRSGAYLYTKLINCENRMSEMGDPHTSTNIDARYVVLKGYNVSLFSS